MRRFLSQLFGIGPTRVESFSSFALKTNPLAPVHQPEKRTFCLKKELGEMFSIEQPAKWLGHPLSPSSSFHKNPRYISEHFLAAEPDRYLYSLDQGAIFGDHGLVYHPESRTLIKESVKDWFLSMNKLPILRAPRLSSPEKLPGIAFSAVTLGGGGYYHFLLESLPRAIFFGKHLSTVDYLLVNGPCTDWKLRWWKHLGVKPDTIRWISGSSHFSFDQLIFTSHLVTDCQPNPWLMDTFHPLSSGDHDSEEAPFIWASRTDAGARQPVWEEELLASLPWLTPIRFSELTPAETIQIINQCQILVAPHGAALSNIIFSKSGSTVVEIFPHDLFKLEYRRLAERKKLRYHFTCIDFHTTQGLSSLIESLNETKHQHGDSLQAQGL